MEPHIPGFAQFEKWEGKKVLEIGCGIGTDTINFARHGAFVTAVDLSERSLELAERRAAVYGLQDRVKFYRANAEELSEVVPIEEYDLIYSFGVVHHTPHPERAIAQLRRYCNSQTVLKLMVYYRYAWKVFWILFAQGKGQFWRLPALVAEYSEAQSGCPVTHTYSRRAAKKMLEAHGFRINEIAVDHIFPYQIEEYVRYQYKKVWYFARMPQPLFHRLESCLGWHLLVTAGST